MGDSNAEGFHCEGLKKIDSSVPLRKYLVPSGCVGIADPVEEGPPKMVSMFSQHMH